MTLEERLWKTFNKALGQFQMIDEDDRILVGLSGGKDSLLLLELLARRSKVHVPRFSVEALHVRMSDVLYESDTTYLQSFCDGLGVPLHIVTTSFASAAAQSALDRAARDMQSIRDRASPPAFSVPGSAANSSSTLPSSWAARR